MKSILIFGSGRSAPSLIKYLARESSIQEWRIIIADKDISLALEYISEFQSCNAISFDITDEQKRDELVSNSDIVLSMLPVRFHLLVLQSCLKYKVNMITPSYQSKEMLEKESEIDEAGILVLNEMGLDPGIDHMSAMKVIDEIRDDGHELTAMDHLLEV